MLIAGIASLPEIPAFATFYSLIHHASMRFRIGKWPLVLGRNLFWVARTFPQRAEWSYSRWIEALC